MKLIISIISVLLATINVGNENKETAYPSFAAFSSHFPLSEMPFIIGHSEMEMFTTDLKAGNSSSLVPIDDYSMIFDYLPEEGAHTFSRMGRIAETYPVARMYLGEDKIAVVYATIPKKVIIKGKQKTRLIPKKKSSDIGFQKVDFKIHIYDLKGNILPIMKDADREDYPALFASRSIDKSCFGSVDMNGIVLTTTYDNEWSLDPYVSGLNGNEIVSYVKVKDESFSLIDDLKSGNSDGQVASTP